MRLSPCATSSLAISRASSCRCASLSVGSGSCGWTSGIGVGAASFERGDFDVAMAVTFLILTVYAGLLVLRHEGLRGRRAALLNLAGFALVAIVLPLTHFAA